MRRGVREAREREGAERDANAKEEKCNFCNKNGHPLHAVDISSVTRIALFPCNVSFLRQQQPVLQKWIIRITVGTDTANVGEAAGVLGARGCQIGQRHQLKGVRLLRRLMSVVIM